MFSSAFQRIQPALPWLGGLIVFACVGALLFSVFRHQDSKPKRHVVTTITKLTLPPPPPPPPPPKVERPPEPQKMVEQPRMREPVKQNTPAPKMPNKSEPMPPASPLTAEAGNGPSGYGLGVGNGEGDVVGGGGGGGGDARTRFSWYGGVIQTRLQHALRDDAKTRKARFKVPVNIWIDPGGRVERTQLVASTGDGSIDTAIREVIGRVNIGEAPPSDMPQPVKLRVSVQPAA